MKKVAISGAHGFIGTALCQELIKYGYEPWPLVRRAARIGEIAYDAERGEIESDKLASCGALINLAGKNIMERPWTESFKEAIKKSRVETTSLLAKTMAKLGDGPKVMLSASAFGFYGDCGDRIVDEDAPAGTDFLAEVCRDWEHATLPASNTGVRVVLTRFGHVMGKEGGIYKYAAPWFKRGLGPSFGSGEQYMPMVALDDLLAALRFALENTHLEGPINVVAPEVPTNKEFAQAFAQSFNKSSNIHVPSWALELLGEQGRMLLSSCRAVPRKLEASGFRFHYPNVRAIMEQAKHAS